MSADYREFINRDHTAIVRGCTSKVPFGSRKEAKSAIKTSRHGDGSMKAYHCRYFDHWHTGHPR